MAEAFAGAWLYSAVVMTLVALFAWRRDGEFRSMGVADRIGASAFAIVAAPVMLPILLFLLVAGACDFE